MPVTNVKSRWSSGSLIFHEDGDLGVSGNLLTLGTDTITFGSATQDVDVMIYLGAADQYVKFDAGAATMTMAKVDVNLGADLAITVEDISLADACSLEFGTDKDVDIQWVNATGILQISPVVDDQGSICIGDGTKDMDFKVFLGTAAAYVLFDVGNVSLVTSAGVTLSVDDTTDSSSATTGSVHTDGGLGVAKKVYVGTDLVMVGGDIDLSTAVTGTYDLILKDAVADALSIRRAATDVIVFDTSTPKVTITPATDIAGVLTSTNATDASAVGTAAVTTAGGLGVTKKLYVGTDLVMVGGDIDMTTAATGTYDLLLKDAEADALSIKRGATDMVVFNSTTPSITITPALTVTGAITCDDATDSSSTITGSIQTDGGLGVAKALFVGTTGTFAGILSVDDTTDSSSTVTGSIHTDGGLGVAKKLYVGDELNVTIAALTAGDTHSAIKAVVTADNPANAYGTAGYFETTLTGNQASNFVYNLGSWINMTAGTQGLYVCAQDNGIYQEAGSDISASRVIFGMRMEAILAEQPARLCPFSINPGAALTLSALFSVEDTPQLGIIAGKSTTNTYLPLFITDDGNVRYVELFS